MDNNKKDPLDELFVDSEEIDRKLLAQLVAPYIELYGDVGEIVPKKNWHELTIPNKLLIFLLARKVLFIKEVIPIEGISPKEIEEQTGLKGNSIRPTLGRLADERLVRKVEEGDGTKYIVPNHMLKSINEILND